jgi:bifunctional DNase/RNase
MDDNFGIGIGSEMMATPLQFGAKFRKIVNLSIEDNRDAVVFIEKRLVASGQVNDAQAAHAQTEAILDENPFVIRPTVHDLLAHVVNRFGADATAIRTDDSCYSAHTYPSRACDDVARLDADRLEPRLKR